MTDVIDIFSKKKVKEKPIQQPVNQHNHYIPPPPATSEDYLSRIDKCISVYMSTGQECSCDYCKDKSSIASKLVDLSRYLILDSNQKTGRKLQVGDWLEIVTLAKMKVENFILKS